MQYAVQQTERRVVISHGIAGLDGRTQRRVVSTTTRLPAFNRAHADDMANGLSERNVRNEWSTVRGEEPTTYTYEVVARVYKSDGSTVWLTLSEIEMIASMYTNPEAMAAE